MVWYSCSSPVPILIIYIGIVISATNEKLRKVERAIILNQNVINALSTSKKDEVLTLTKESLHSKKRFFQKTSTPFEKLMVILNPETEPSHKDILHKHSCKIWCHCKGYREG